MLEAPSPMNADGFSVTQLTDDAGYEGFGTDGGRLASRNTPSKP